ncbi:MAG TPA: DUF6298 domain-containing protein [Tepidisphaeraceae bacterium]|nr:DUF6298 domain-containing protein [Tepidisphaeraceae bacterium]
MTSVAYWSTVMRCGIAVAICCATAAAQAPPATQPAVAQAKDGRLVYATDQRGNRVIDFSHCGYMGGEDAIPDVPVRVVVPHQAGDATARIQAAIDYVGSLPPDQRGAVLLENGRYDVAGALKIAASGVVLRGSGMGEGENGTVIVATGQDRRTLVQIAGSEGRTIDGLPVAIIDPYVPVHATQFRVANAGGFQPGDAVMIHRPCTIEWIKTLGMDYLGGERHGYSWKPGSRDVLFDRTVTRVQGDRVFIDAPITTALDSEFGGGTITPVSWPGRISSIGVENLRLESSFDPAKPKDEDHSWIAITIDQAIDTWVRQVTFAHFAGGAVHVGASCRRVTVEDCKSLAPVSEIGGHRRHTFFTAGQQTLFQRCYSEHGIRDFAVGFCSPGPNAFVQCEAKLALGDSGPIDSWGSGVLYDNVKIDGNALVLADRRFELAGAGWSGANSMMWQCQAAVIRCYAPPTAQNWATGCWGTFDGDGLWQQSNEHIRPRSLYYAQLAERIGPTGTDRAQLLPDAGDASTSPSIEQAAALTALAAQPVVQLSAWIDDAPKRNPIPTDAAGAKTIDQIGIPAAPAPGSKTIAIRDGVIVCGDEPLTGGRQNVQWWRGSLRPAEAAKMEVSLTRYVPGRFGQGLTDDLDELTDAMAKNNKVALDHNYGLWYDRRRDDHQRVRRMDGDVWPPFYEQPFDRSGQGTAWDGLSKYDLTKYNPWYFDRLRAFVRLGEQKGIVLLNHHYFQHNILEAGAHWADSPWRSANNINDTGFPEPPPYAGDKRIFLAEQFYDVTDPKRRELHRAFIRKCLDNHADQRNVIHLTSAEFTGPLHFVQFWLDVAGEWERETGKDAFIGLSATKDVQDAILADSARARVVDVIDIRYWWYRKDGSLYAPQGGQNLAPRQHARQGKPGGSSPEMVERAMRDYREKYPEKAVIYSADGYDRFGAAAAKGGGSLAQVKAGR